MRLLSEPFGFRRCALVPLIALATAGLVALVPAGRAQAGPAPGASGGGQYVEAVPASGAQAEPPSDASAVHQYVEAVPTSGGSSTPGMTKEKRAPLPKKAKDNLKKASSATTAKALEEVATSSTYGAPSVSPAKPKKDGVGDSPSSDASAGSILDSTVSIAATTTDSRLLGLFGVLLVTTAGAIALAVRQSRL